MTIFVAGGSGAIGIPLVRALVTAGHNVVATTRSPGKQTMLRQLGAMPVVVDALDAAAMDKAVRSAAPTHVIHQLTALPKTGARRASDLEPTNRLRDEGTRCAASSYDSRLADAARRALHGAPAHDEG